MRPLLLCLALSCGSSNTAPGDELAKEQPVVKDGVRSTYSIDLAALAPEARPAALEQAVRTIRLRLQRAKITAHVAVDKDMLVVDVASVSPEVIVRATDLVHPVGRFVVQLAEPGSAVMTALATQVPSDPEAARSGITSVTNQWATPDGKRFSDSSLQAEDRQESMTIERAKELGCFRGPTGSGSAVCRVSGCKVIEGYVAALAAREPRFAIPSDHALVCAPARQSRAMQPAAWRAYYVERTPVVEASIRRATAVSDPENHPSIQIELDRSAAQKLATVTKQHIGFRIAIAIDGRVVSVPIVMGAVERISFAVHDDRRLAEQNADDARDLAIVLGAGPLPGRMVLETRAQLVDGVPRFDR